MVIKAHCILLKLDSRTSIGASICTSLCSSFSASLKVSVSCPYQAVIKLIIRKYCYLSSTAEVNYFRFCNDLDRPEDIFSEYKPKLAQPGPVYIKGIQPKQVSPLFSQSTTENDVIANHYLQTRVEL